MRIAIDGGCLSNRRGFGRFARELLAALARLDSEHEFLVFVDQPSLNDPLVQVPDRFKTVAVPVREAPSKAASASGRRGLRDLLAMGRAVARSRPDVVFFPASYSFFPVWNARHVLVTIFDALPLRYPELVFSSWKSQTLWRLKERAAVHRADRVLTTSNASRRDLMQHYRLSESRIGLLTAGPDRAFQPTGSSPLSNAVLAKYGISAGERYLLYVGGLSPHKNLPRLLQAFERAAPSIVRLVVVGDPADVFLTHVPEIRGIVERLGLGQQVLFTGFVPDADLAHLYSRAYALVQPSLMEGFGLTPIEAMACGTPVLSSTAGSLPEVVGQGGVFFDPSDLPGMASAIANLLADPVQRDLLADRALWQVQRFSWEASARMLLDEITRFRPRARVHRGPLQSHSEAA